MRSFFERGPRVEGNSDDLTDRRAYRALPQSEDSSTSEAESCWSLLNHSFSFSDLVCCVCLGLVGVFGAAGLFLGFAIPFYLIEYMKTLSSEEMALFGLLPPFLGMFICMGLAFCVWGRSIDWARGWEVGVAQRRGEGMLAACQEFVSSSNPCLRQLTARLESSAQLTDTTDAQPPENLTFSV